MSTRRRPGLTACGPPSAPSARPTEPMAARNGELDTLARRTRHVLIDFDGPICEIFAGTPGHDVADELRRQLRAVRIDIPPGAETSDDPLEVFRVVADLGGQADAIAQALLTALEVQAVQTAQPVR